MMTQHLAILSVEIVKFIIREPEASMDNLESIEELLLNRFKLSPEALKTKFVKH